MEFYCNLRLIVNAVTAQNPQSHEIDFFALFIFPSISEYELKENINAFEGNLE